MQGTGDTAGIKTDEALFSESIYFNGKCIQKRQLPCSGMQSAQVLWGNMQGRPAFLSGPQSFSVKVKSELQSEDRMLM